MWPQEVTYSQGMIFCQCKASCDISVQYLMMQLHTHNRQYFNLNETHQVLPHSQEPTRHRRVHRLKSIFSCMYSILLPNPVKIFSQHKALILRGNIPWWLYGLGTKSMSNVWWSARLKWWLRRCYVRSALNLLAYMCVCFWQRQKIEKKNGPV